MRAIVCVLALSILSACAVQAQSPSASAVPPPQHRTHGTHSSSPQVSARKDGAKKEQQVPSIIQAELDRSRAEAKQMQPISLPPVQQSAPTPPVWPLFVSLGVGATVTGALLFFFFVRKRSPKADVRSTPSSSVLQQPGSQARPVVASPRVYEPPVTLGDDRFDAADVQSSSPYVAEDDEREMPEAALTMNLLNKKRETKKELILEVMKRVQRRENPQHIAEALRIGIGEVHLAMTLAKLKK